MPDAPALLATAPVAPDDLCLFDCLAPFFVTHGGGSVNWSKVPFARLERDGVLDEATAGAILAAAETHLAAMAGLGYNAVAVDDLAHLVVHPFYPDALRRKLTSYRRLYERLFALVKAHGLRLFVITDYMFFNPAIETRLRETGAPTSDLFLDTVSAAVAAHPEIDGVVLRFGESDGVDVADDFKSRLTIQHPRQARALLQRLLPEFERQGLTLVFRTWTLGAYPIGDLMWNRRTYDAVFAGIASPNLVVSLKYGDADFFRYLELNPLFFHGPQRKLVELQCRREYEGMGEYPSFVGFAYARYLAGLRDGGSNLAGVYAIQAGGWAPFSRLAYCADGSLWNELNTYVTARLFRTRQPVSEIVAGFCHEQGIADVDGFLRLLALSERAIEEGLYVREFALRPVYFRRVRVPPLSWVFWNNVTAGGLVGLLHRYLVRDKAAAVAEGHRAVETVREMLLLARRIGLPDDDLRFQLATFRILAHLREVLLGLDTPETHERLATLLAEYHQQYPAGYLFDYGSGLGERASRQGAFLIRLLCRYQTDYRRGDRLLLNRHVTRLKAMAVRRLQSKLPRFVDKQGMTAEALLR